MSLPATFVELCEAQQEKKISNVIGVVVDLLPPRMTTRGDHMLTFTLDDGTTQHGQKCRLFTKSAAELPQISGLGDVVVLRRVRFTYINGQGLLSSMLDESAPWAVFHAPIPKDLGLFESGIRYIRSKKAPLVTKQEQAYVISLDKTKDRSKFTILTEDVKEKLTSKSNAQPCLIKDLVMDSFSQIIGEVIKIFSNGDRTSLYITDYTENHLLYEHGAAKREVDEFSNGKKWPGPPGKYTLLIECWPPHSSWIKEQVESGDLLRVKNVHIKANKDNQGRIEGLLHTDKLYPDKIYLTKLKPEDADALLLRKEELGWADGFEMQEEEVTDPKGKKRKRDNSEQAGSGRNKARKEKRKLAAMEPKTTETESKKVPPQSTPRTEIQEAINSINENIRCEKGDYPELSIAEIRDTSKRHRVKLPNGQFTTMDFLETTSYATVRVVDFKPSRIEDFARAVEMSPEELREAEVAVSQHSESPDSDHESDHSDTSLHNKSTQVRHRKWQWKFALLLEDASSTHDSPSSDDKQNNQLITYINGPEAEYLLGMKALDLRANQRSLAQLKEKLFILWGELEERKQEKQAQVLEEVSINASSSGSSKSSQTSRPPSKPFKCLIEEYGEQVSDKWQRRFRLKGTTIMQGSSPRPETPVPKQGLESWDEVEDLTVGTAQPENASLRAPRAG